MIRSFILTIDVPGGARYRNAVKEAARLEMPWQFVPGVRLKDPIDAQEYSRLLNFLFYRRSITRGEVSTYLGHRRAWNHFLSDQADFGLILEDDFQIMNQEELLRAIRDATAHPDSWDIIKFFDVWSKRPVAAMQLGSTQFLCRKYPPNGAVAYLINKRAAKALLSRQRIYRPVDEDLSRPWEFSLRVWSSERNLVTENAQSLGGSLLQQERVEEEWLKHKNPFRRIVMRNCLELEKLIRAKRYGRMMKSASICKAA